MAQIPGFRGNPLGTILQVVAGVIGSGFPGSCLTRAGYNTGAEELGKLCEQKTGHLGIGTKWQAVVPVVGMVQDDWLP